MGKTKTVAVDAEKFHRLKSEVYAFAAYCALRGHQSNADKWSEIADLTPIVPTLPAKWGPCETIENSEERIVLKIGWRYYCISGCGMWANKDNRAPEQADYRFVIPLPIATYLLHAWSNR